MPGPSADPVVEIRRFSPDLAPRPGMTTLDGYVERYAALAMLPDGRSLVAVNETPDVAGSQIRLQLIDANGAAVGAPVDGPVGRDPQLAAGAGAVALTWFEDSSPAGERVGVQLWDPEAMVPLGAELGVDDAPATGTPKILATADGWLVVWVYNEFNDGGVLSARLLDAAGQPTAPSVELNEPVTTAHGSNARITSPVLELIGSRLVAAWQVYRFTPILPAPCDISFALEVQQFRLDLATSLNEIPALDWRGLLALVALLAVVAWRRLG